MFTALLAFSVGAPAAPQFQVENKCPCQFVVTNKVVPKKMSPAKGCVCAGECKCADGTCPGSCPVQTASGVRYVQTCGPTGCQMVAVPDGASSCANGSCAAPQRSGWYPGKLLGRRR